ncbi:hypothetical protein [Geomonas propionica]|uniref:Uncharacterized protein n=1 Tax=Geomonas propionica TaxID=2798582 RepID=A0ABS0YYB1_9BACT|nr:hypothetical protein [Geomonas propionica]MBJ6802477.1 hypothetical protein [Geomonas propionica]
MRTLFAVVLLILFSFASAYASPSPELMMNRASMISPHGDGTAGLGPARPMADVIKDATLPGYPKVKIGEAFGKYGYFKQKQWYETRGAAGNFYVDFRGSSPTGWFDFKGRRAGIAEKGLVLKFVIYPSGEYGIVMASKTVQTKDGKTTAYPIPDIKGVVDAIYANKKLDL